MRIHAAVAMASAAIVPRTVATAQDSAASQSERRNASRRLSLSKKARNQRRLKDGGGKTKNSVGEKAVTSTIRIGPSTSR